MSNRFVRACVALAATLAPCAASPEASASNSPNETAAVSTASYSNAAATTGTETTAAAAAAQAFMDTLADEQKATLVGDYDDNNRTITWSNFPVTFVQRGDST